MLLACAWPGLARAERQRVVLLDRPDSDEIGLELSARVRGELRAAGFEVVVRTLPNDVEPRQATENAARELEPAAVLVVRKSVEAGTGTPVAELWIAGRSLDRTIEQRVPLSGSDANRAVAKFAVQVAELVKARLAELAISGRTSAPARPAVPAAPEPLPAPAEPEVPRVRALIGPALGALTDVGAGDTALLPLLRAGVLLATASTDFELRATVGAFGTTITAGQGPLHAELEQALASAELVLHFDTDLPISPALLAGAGVHTLRARGRAPEGYVTRSERAWAGLGTLGAGIVYTPVIWLRWSLDAQGIVAGPPSVVTLAGRDLPERGRWLALFSTGLSGSF